MLLQNVIGFLMALLLNQRLPTRALLRSLVLLPWVLPGVVAAILWRFMYDPQLGLINSFLIRLGLVDQGVGWLAEPVDRDGRGRSSPRSGRAFRSRPWSILAALQNVDQEQVEAAIIDGAGQLRRLFDVTLPSIRAVIGRSTCC